MKKQAKIRLKEPFCLKKQKGITLVALVITIIILLILAGITISALKGSELFEKAQQAQQETEEAKLRENTILNEFAEEIDKKVGGSGGATEEPGKTNSSKNRTLSDATTGYTYKNPVIPQGFKAVDTADAKWEYIDAEKTTVRGWDEGLVIEDVYNQNQFVWVPCTTSVTTDTVAYVKDFSLSSYYGATSSNTSNATDSTIVDSVTYKAVPVTESTQIGKYKGFYVARYEAGLPTETTSQSTELNNVYTSTPVSKAGSKIWNYVDYTHSYVAANKMVSDTTKYGNNKSGLITGTQWDTIMAWYKKAGIGVEKTTQNWGTYRDKTYGGTGLYYTDNGSSTSSWQNGSFSHTRNNLTTATEAEPRHYHASGLNGDGIKKNIADLGGNVWEWSAEVSHLYSGYRVRRGGSAGSSKSQYPAGDRYADGDYQEGSFLGFRSVLYIQ